MTDPETPSESVTVKSLIYHTVDHTTEHPEGDEYVITDRALAQTLIAIGFVAVVPTAAP